MLRRCPFLRLLSRSAFLALALSNMGCRMGGDIEEFIENGLATVSVREISFASGGRSLSCVPSLQTVQATLAVINPSAVKVRYTVSWDSAFDGLFATKPIDKNAAVDGIQVAETNAGEATFSFALASEAEWKTIPLTVELYAPGVNRSFESKTLMVICDSPPDVPDAIAAGHESGTGAPVLAFTLPAAARNEDIATATITWKNVVKGTGGSETIAIDAAALTTAPGTDPLSGTGGTKRFYAPSGTNAAYAYYFTVTLQDGRGQASGKANAITDRVMTALTVDASGGSGTGSVSLSPAGGTYDYGTSVILTPTGSGGCRLNAWTGTDGPEVTDNGDGTYTIVMEGDKGVSAAFEKVLVACGGSHTLLAVTNGPVWALGADTYGQLGNGTTSTGAASAPVRVLGLNGSGYLSGVTAIAAGSFYNLALTASGSVYSWGRNNYGQLGIGGTMDSAYPIAVSGLPGGVTSIAAGKNYEHSFALTSSGAVYSWGINAYYQLGLGDTTNRSAPAAVGDLASGVVAVAAGNLHSQVLKDGFVYSWGTNSHGELGNGTYTTATAPERVLGVGGSGYLSGVAAVAAGAEYTVALLSDGTVRAWGRNDQSQIGNGVYVSAITYPVQVVGTGGSGYLSDIVAIAAGGYHALALSASGTVYAWGSNYKGQLGNGGPPSQIPYPVAVSGLPRIVAISAGNQHSLAVAEDGTVWAWGDNSYGQLGDGSPTQQSTPVKVDW